MTHENPHHARRWAILAVLGIAQLMVVLDATIVNIALPTIQSDLDFSQADLQWVINSYTLLFGGFLLLGGRAADLIGRRTLFVAGVAVFTFASAVNALATSEAMLIGGRALVYGFARMAIDGHFPRWGVAKADVDRTAEGVLDLFISGIARHPGKS